MNGIVAAFGATGLYYVGFAIFKVAADRIEPLRTNRLLRLIWLILSNWIFLIGLALVLGGLALQILALTEVSLAIGVPIFMSGVFLLLLIALVFFGERLTGREWLSLLMIGAALLLITASIGNPPPIRAVDVPLEKLAVIITPALLVPAIIWMVGDHRPDGKHARQITGIAYGLSSGIPIGTAELCIKGWSDAGISVDSLLTPYPYATVASAVIGFGVLMAGFQRCRVSIVAVVMTVSAKTHLLVTGSFMYGEPWPQDVRYFGMRLGALALAVIGVLQFPRHRPVAQVATGDDARKDVPSPVLEPPPGAERPPERRPTAGLPSPSGQLAFGQSSYIQPSAGDGPSAGYGQVPGDRQGEPAGAGRPGVPGLSAPTPFDEAPPFEDAPPGQSPFDRPRTVPPPGRRPPQGRSPAGHLAPDRASGPQGFGRPGPPGGDPASGTDPDVTGEYPLPLADQDWPPATPPEPSPYAQDPLGRGPSWDDDPFAGDPSGNGVEERSGGAREGAWGDRRYPGSGGARN